VKPWGDAARDSGGEKLKTIPSDSVPLSQFQRAWIGLVCSSVLVRSPHSFSVTKKVPLYALATISTFLTASSLQRSPVGKLHAHKCPRGRFRGVEKEFGKDDARYKAARPRSPRTG